MLLIQDAGYPFFTHVPLITLNKEWSDLHIAHIHETNKKTIVKLIDKFNCT